MTFKERVLNEAESVGATPINSTPSKPSSDSGMSNASTYESGTDALKTQDAPRSTGSLETKEVAPGSGIIDNFVKQQDTTKTRDDIISDQNFSDRYRSR